MNIRPTIRVQPRNGNRSGSILKSIEVKVPGSKRTRKIPQAIGAVQAGANLDTGEGIKFERGYGLDQLNDADHQRIKDWLATANVEPSARAERPSLDGVNAKLDELLAIVRGAPAAAQVAPSAAMPEPIVVDPESSALAQLPAVLQAAVAELTARVKNAQARGVKLTKQRHAGIEPAGDTELDQLQAQTNYLRSEVLPQFEKTCKALGLMLTVERKKD